MLRAANAGAARGGYGEQDVKAQSSPGEAGFRLEEITLERRVDRLVNLPSCPRLPAGIHDFASAAFDDQVVDARLHRA